MSEIDPNALTATQALLDEAANGTGLAPLSARKIVTAYLNALHVSVLVPCEPTFAMLRAADERTGTGEPYRDIYRAMINAAPNQQTGGGK